MYVNGVLSLNTDKLSYVLDVDDLGIYDVAVRAKASGQFASSELSETVKVTISAIQLSSPEVTLTDSVLGWQKVENAVYYRIFKNGRLIDETEDTAYAVDVSKMGVHAYGVVAVSGKGRYTDSEMSGLVKVLNGTSVKDSVSLTEMDYADAVLSGHYNVIEFGKSVSGDPAISAGQTFEDVIGVHPYFEDSVNAEGINQDINYLIEGLGYNWFSVRFAINDIVDGNTNIHTNKVRFTVLVDGEVAASSLFTHFDYARKFVVNVKGAKVITLRTNNGGDSGSFDSSLWIEPTLFTELGDRMSLVGFNWESADAPGDGSAPHIAFGTDIYKGEAEVNRVKYSEVIGTHSIDDINRNQDIVYDIGGFGFKYLDIMIGVADWGRGNRNQVVFTILADGEVIMNHTAARCDNARRFLLDVAGVKKLTLRVNCGIDGYAFDSSFWINPYLYFEKPASLSLVDVLHTGDPAGFNTIQYHLDVEEREASVNGVKYTEVIGTHTYDDITKNQDIIFDISKYGYTTFTAKAGIQDVSPIANIVVFTVLVDGVEADTVTFGQGTEPYEFTVDVTGASTLTLRVNCGVDGFAWDSALWIEPALSGTGGNV